MGIGQRIHDSIDQWSKEWKDRLGGWIADVFLSGATQILDKIEDETRDEATASFGKIRDIPNLPPEFHTFIDKAEGKAMPQAVVAVIPYLIGIVIGTAMGAARPIANWMSYPIENLVRSARLDPLLATRALFRGFITKEYFSEISKDSGWSDDDIETIINVSHYYPSALELVNWQAKEVFEPTMREKYGLGAELEELERDAFYKAGMTDEQIDNFWMAHWVHPAFREITEMLHRGEVTSEDVYSWYRLVEIPPYWRDKLTAISWDLPNRIELRMMARYGLVDKSFLVKQLEMVGLREDFRDVAADMMLAMGIRTDLSTRFSKGWITADQVKQELIDSGLSEDVQVRMFQWIVKNTGTDRVVKERDLTLSDIYKGIKKGVISYVQGLELIQDMGFDEWEARYKLEVNVGALEGSPEGYQEFKKVTQLYRQSQGLPAKIPSEDIIQAERDVKETQATLDKALEEGITGKKLTEMREAVEEAKLRYHQLLQEFAK